MSKMDNLRAMREARYEQAKAAGAKPAAKRPTSAKAAAKTAASAPAASTTPAEAEADEQLCGHRNMSGRTCTREHGHSAKSHRYS